MSIGVALSGGGVRGACHIGALKALEEGMVKIDAISGTSMGAIVGTLYACGYTPEEMAQIFEQYDLDNLFQGKLSHKRAVAKLLGVLFSLWARDGEGRCGLFHMGKVERILEQLLLRRGARMMTDTAMFLAMPAVDLKSGRTVFFVSDKRPFVDAEQRIYIDRAQLAEAARASASFPVVFSPYTFDGFCLSDGGITTPIPIDVLRRWGAKRIIGIHTGMTDNEKKTCYSVFDVASRTIGLMGGQLSSFAIQEADAKIRLDTKVGTFDFTKVSECIAFGYSETKRQMPQILSKAYF